MNRADQRIGRPRFGRRGRQRNRQPARDLLREAGPAQATGASLRQHFGRDLVRELAGSGVEPSAKPADLSLIHISEPTSPY